MCAITNLDAGVPVTDLDESNAVNAGAGRITLGVAGLDALLERFSARASTTSRSRPTPTPSAIRRSPIRMGNAIAFAEPHDAA